MSEAIVKDRQLASRLHLRLPWAWIFTVLLGVFLLFPIFPVVYQAFLDKPIYDHDGSLTYGNFVRLFEDPEFLHALWNTFVFASLTTIISTAVGLLVSLVVDRLAIPLRRTLRLLFLAPIFVSPLILSFAWSMLYGRGGYATLFLRTQTGITVPDLNSMGGMSLIAAVAYAPVSYLYFSGTMANIPDSLEKAARTSGAGYLTAVRDIILPLLKPSILYCLLLNFMLTVDLLAVPIIIGEPARISVLATYLYAQGMLAARPDYGIVGAAGVCMILFAQAIVWLQSRWIGDNRRYTTVGGRASAISRVTPGIYGWPITLVLAIYIIIVTVLPLAFLCVRSFTSLLSPLIPIKDVLTLDNYRVIFSYAEYVRSIWNTVLISAVGSVAAVAFTLVSAIVAYRTSSTVRFFIEQLSVIPRAVPGLIVGLGFFYAITLLPGVSFIRETVIVLAIAYIVRYFPTGFGAVSPAFLQIGEELERAARMSGSTRWQAVRDVTIPLVKGALGASYILFVVQFFKEYSSAAFLFRPGTEVIGTTMLQLDMLGYLGSLAALAVVQLVITVPLAIAMYARD
ncbi:MAG TPA: iron ABC transporter permease [Bauldia sp.]|nr:iron ABC transporter permease [Bauldia sp.]